MSNSEVSRVVIMGAGQMGRGFYRYDEQGNRLEPSIRSWSTV